MSPIGESRDDWEIFCDLSTRMGFQMKYENPAEIMDEIASIVSLYTNVTYQNLDDGGILWPLIKARKRFFSVEYRKPFESPNEEYPLLIVPRGFHYYYGIGTLGKRAKGLARVFSDTALEMNPEDARNAGVNGQDRVKLISPRASVETICRISEALPAGTAYLAVQFFPIPVNNLLSSERDPVSGNPEYKACIGRVERS